MCTTKNTEFEWKAKEYGSTDRSGMSRKSSVVYTVQERFRKRVGL